MRNAAGLLVSRSLGGEVGPGQAMMHQREHAVSFCVLDDKSAPVIGVLKVSPCVLQESWCDP